ncbi:MAG: PIG-L family deacetylase, partial [Candidatus Eisenbacteria sp.]|nr:PIG-L family deacetylase [Candidatus Eisenbacteria bacterium]
ARWRRRAAAVNRHNALPTQVVLEVRTSLRRWTHTFSKFPITVGTTPGCTLQLTNGGKAPDQAFELRLADEGLLFSSKEKLNVNGVPRRSVEIQEGGQVRLGKYRISYEQLILTTPLPPPAATYWRIAGLPALSIVAATLLFVFHPLAGAPPEPTGAQPPIVLSTGPRTTVEHHASAGSSLPALYGPRDTIRYFDADYLVIHAHPDDETLDFGILLARLDAAGLRGAVVLLTDGQNGRDQYPRRETGGIYPAYDLTGNELAQVRVVEARNAMAHLGVDAYIRGMLPNFPYNSITDQLTVAQVLDKWGGLWAIVDALAEVVVGFSPELVISPDLPRGPYEHFEHEATGVIVATLLDSLNTSGLSTVRGHLLGIDPLQTSHYDKFVEISPWDLNPVTGVSFRTVQLRALAEHRTQRDSSVVGIETRLAVPAEYYAVGFWDPEFAPPPGIGIDLPSGVLSEMALPPGR